MPICILLVPEAASQEAKHGLMSRLSSHIHEAHPWAKRVMKKSLASIDICSRLSGDKVIRTLVNAPAIPGNNN